MPGIVDAVAHHGNNPALLLQAPDLLRFVPGKHFGEDFLYTDVLATFRAVSWRSPVIMATSRPMARSRDTVGPADALGTSAMAIKPMSRPDRASQTQVLPTVVRFEPLPGERRQQCPAPA